MTSGQTRDQVDAAFRAAAAANGITAAAAPDNVLAELEGVIRHVQQTPIAYDIKPAVTKPLMAMLAAPPQVPEAVIQAWHFLRKTLPLRITLVDRAPVKLPIMPDTQAAAWSVILKFEDSLDCHWSLIGGQMVAFTCTEHGYPEHRATDDGDIILGVWLDRTAFRQAISLLSTHGFAEDRTSDDYGYRYRRDAYTTIDLLLPEGIHEQKTAPTTSSNRSGLEVPGGNQALIRSERVPVQLGTTTGFVRRPNLLGALVAKSAAAVTDTRDPDRHKEDIAVLGQIALTAGAYRSMQRESKGKDRRRLRRALLLMPETHAAWRGIAEPREVRSALERLATVNVRGSSRSLA
ncbi:hypothetical protein [Lentzea sp. NPDC092896]|uniref:hypothetical protein n=1 Tax=Lentzea sp. NPDC092896 TaxID=3364127 RepID=UPI00381A44C3